MAKGKRNDDQQQQSRWWFADNDEFHYLVERAVNGDQGDKVNLRLVAQFVRQGYTDLGAVIPVGLMAPFAARSSLPEQQKIVESYPSLLGRLTWFAGGDVRVVRSPTDCDLVTYVAAANIWGMCTGHVVVGDAKRPWKHESGVPFVGLVLYYKIVG